MPGANLTQLEAQQRRATVISPLRYHVALNLAQGATNFTSDTTITFGAQEASHTFLDLIADSVQSITLNGKELDPSEVYADSRIELDHLQARNEVRVVAQCRYSNTGEGLHRSVDPSDGNVYLYSQFEVPDARRMYAVFDQPDMKAVFDFEVVAPASWIVTSNMPVKAVSELETLTQEGTLGSKPQEITKQWVFESTPQMSSYLTAICAGPYAEWHTEYANEDGRVVPMAMYCRQSLREGLDKDAAYLFDITKKGFAFYAKTWGVPYPYAKYDQIYVPEYNAGAMENIGMVTIRDQYVFNSKVTDAYAERRVVTVLHELAHMWFGDYVTMKWWNDLWLNESFAEFTSTLATAEATDWHDAWATFCSGEKSWALRQDQLPTTHPIVATINDLNDTAVNFDGITYAKGASVLKQLVAYVGREHFFEGINHYLTKHAYANATLADLLGELEATSGRDLKTWSSQWLEQAGINTIAAEVSVDAEGRIEQLLLRQSAPEAFPVLRPHRLAIGFYNRNENTGKVERTERFELDVTGEETLVDAVRGLKRPDAIVVNDDDLTYTKVRFDAQSLAFISEHLYEFDDALARAIVWLALWDMTRDGEYDAERFVEVSLKALATERESTTFRVALNWIAQTAHHFVAQAHRSAVIAKVAQALWRLAGEAEPGSDEQFQLVSAYLAYAAPGDAAFIKQAQGLLSGDIAFEGLEIDNNLRWAIIAALSTANAIDEQGIEAELKQRETTENREFALLARASASTKEAKLWAWEQALKNQELTNAQLSAIVRGFASTSSQELQQPYAAKFFEQVDWIWEHKTFHMAETVLVGLFPSYADLHDLVERAEHWLTSHEDAPAALRRIILEHLDTTQRALRVTEYNESLLK